MKIFNYSFEYLIFGFQKKYSQKKNSLYRFFPPKITYKGNSDRITTNISSLLGDYGSFKDNWFDKTALKLIIDKANEILSNQFDLFGSGLIKLDPIDWHKDFKSGYRWPAGKFYKDYIQVDLTNNADVKVPRELSRSNYMLWLGTAYLITRDEKYTKHFIYLIKNWIEENPLMRSINWGCTMDVAIRVVNWIVAFNMFQGSRLIDTEFKKVVINSLFEHGWFIFKNPEKNFTNNANHYDADLVGLLLLGTVFVNTRNGKIWYKSARQELYKEIRHQILPSGVIYEKTISYIRLVQEMFLFSYLLLKKVEKTVPQDITYRIEKTFEFTLRYIKPNSKAPQIGDQDNARFLPFSYRPHNDHKYLLSIASVLFQRGDFKAYSSGYIVDVFFLLGSKSFDSYRYLKQRNNPVESERFSDAGFFIMRSADNYLFINNSGLGKYPELAKGASSHTHADMLSFELSLNGYDVIIDPGTSAYTSNPEKRNLFRSTAKHNTVVVDNHDQFELSTENLFAYNTKAYPHHILWRSTSNYDLYIGSHNAYNRLKNPLTHRRSFYFNKVKDFFVIKDFFHEEGLHKLDIFFYFSPEVKAVEKGNIIFLDYPGGKAQMDLSSNIEMKLSIEKTSISPAYGEMMSSTRLHVLLNKKDGNCYIETRIEKI